MAKGSSGGRGISPSGATTTTSAITPPTTGGPVMGNTAGPSPMAAQAGALKQLTPEEQARLAELRQRIMMQQKGGRAGNLMAAAQLQQERADLLKGTMTPEQSQIAGLRDQLAQMMAGRGGMRMGSERGGSIGSPSDSAGMGGLGLGRGGLY